MKAGLILLAIFSTLAVIIAVVFEYVAFFTGYWLKVKRAAELSDNEELVAASNDVQVSSTRIESSHGLWDNGISDLNCVVTPFGICMYTRASLFTGVVLLSVALVFTVISTAVIASGGNIGTGGTLARASAILLTLTEIAVFIGLVIFTVQHTSCISFCAPKYTFYPQYPDDLSFDWSFILAWIGLFFIIVATVLQYLLSWMSTVQHKTTYSPTRHMAEATSDDIALVRMNDSAVASAYNTNPRKV